MKQLSFTGPLGLALLSGGMAMLLATFVADAGPRARGGARTSVNHAGPHPQGNRGGNVNRNVNHNTNVNRNTNINRDVDRHRDVDIDVDVDHGWHDGWYDHPIATTAAVTATAAVTSAVIGSIVYSVPPNCVPVGYGGVTYQQCGSTWYQPQYSGTTVQYVVVNPPR